MINLEKYFRAGISPFLKNQIEKSIFTRSEIKKMKTALLLGTRGEALELVRGDIGAILKNDPSLSTKPDQREVLMQQSLKVRFFHTVAHQLYRGGDTLLARALMEGIKRITGIEIHPGATIGERLTLDHGVGVVVGETAEIGNDVLMFHGVTLGGLGGGAVKRHPTIGNRVLIGAHAQLLGNLTIGDDAKIGANAIVLGSVEANKTIVGVHKG
jgi:serine O-acetyltransferase